MKSHSPLRQLRETPATSGTSTTRWQALVEHVWDIISLLDREGKVMYTSPSVHKLLGYNPEARSGAYAFDLVHPEDLKAVQAAFQDMLGADDSSHPVEYRFKHADGSWRSLESVGTNLLDVPTVGGVVMTSRDVTDRREAEDALAHHALHDRPTGLPNRTLLLDRVQQMILKAQREDKAVGLFVLDLSGFHEINQAFGHEYGDELLRQMGPRLRTVLRESDTVARIGGDEFAVALPLTGHIADAELMATKLGSAVEQPFTVLGSMIEVGAGIGVAVYPNHGAEAAGLLRRADTAVFEAKRLRESYVVYASEHDRDSAARITLTRELRHGIGKHELELYFQPQVSLATGKIVAVESLVRWSHPDRGLMEPNSFIPVAEQSGLIKPLSYWVLAAAIKQCVRWVKAGAHIPVSVNLSMRNLRDPALPETVGELLAATGLEPAFLTIEITETAIMMDPVRTLDILARLTEMGLTLCVDDFGTGYSSLTYLKRLPLSEVKIDQSFVGDMLSKPNDAVIVHSTIELAHALKLRVVAEGVESDAQMQRLRELGCDAAQGHFLGRPVPAEGLPTLLHG